MKRTLLLAGALCAFLGTSAQTVDIKGESISLAEYCAKGQQLDINLVISNPGTETITTADFNYTVDGNTYTKNITGLNITPGTMVELTHPDKWTASTAGSFYNVKAWLSNLNGKADANTANDNASRDIYVSNFLPQRLVLVEEFTNSSCGPCAAQNPAFNSLLKDNISKVGVIKYQVWWPGANDPMYKYDPNDVSPRVGYYGVSGVPYTRLDGVAPTGASYYDGAPGNVNAALLDKKYNVPAGFDIGFNSTLAGNTVEMSIDITSRIATKGSVMIYVAAIEDEINYSSPPGNNGEREFYQVMRKMFPSATGTFMGLVKEGQTKNLKFSYTPDGVVKTDKLRFLVWVQNASNKMVYQSYWSPAGQLTWSGINEQPKTNIIQSVYPNPVSDIAFVNFKLDKPATITADVYDLTGRLVKNINTDGIFREGERSITFDVSQLPKGIYYVSLKADGQAYMEKFIVQ